MGEPDPQVAATEIALNPLLASIKKNNPA